MGVSPLEIVFLVVMTSILLGVNSTLSDTPFPNSFWILICIAEGQALAAKVLKTLVRYMDSPEFIILGISFMKSILVHAIAEVTAMIIIESIIPTTKFDGEIVIY